VVTHYNLHGAAATQIKMKMAQQHNKI